MINTVNPNELPKLQKRKKLTKSVQCLFFQQTDNEQEKILSVQDDEVRRGALSLVMHLSYVKSLGLNILSVSVVRRWQ